MAEGKAARMSKSRQASDRRKGHLELVRGRDDSRPFIHLLMNFLHRTDRDRRGLYSGDLDLAAVGETAAWRRSRLSRARPSSATSSATSRP